MTTGFDIFLIRKQARVFFLSFRQFIKKRRHWKIPTIAIALTLFQVSMACFFSPHPDFVSSYRSLCQWDCHWYEGIAKTGYHSTIPPVPQDGGRANVAFFPGYPMIARLLYLVFRVDVTIGLLITAQIACVAFWIFFIRILHQWGVGRSAIILSVAAILAHPASFYLVTGYSESLFLASFLSLAYFSYQTEKRSSVYAAISGFLMTATRIVGIPMAGFPIFYSRFQRLKRSAWISAVSVVGAGLFFLFCEIQFGTPDLYMQTQKVGWGIVPNYLAVLHFHSLFAMTPWDKWTTDLSYLAILVMCEIEVLLYYFIKDNHWRTRFPLYACAGVAFYITIAGLASRGMSSVVRYSLVWSVIFVLCLANISMVFPSAPKRVKRVFVILMIFLLAATFYNYQLPHLLDFLNGRWFA